MNETQFSTLSSKKIFAKCAIPGMLSMLFSSIYTIADGMFVGKFIGADALAAVNLLIPLILIISAFSELIAVGSCVQISIKLGEKNNKQASGIFTVSILILLTFSAFISVVGTFFSADFILLLGGDEALSLLAHGYLEPLIIASPFFICFFALDNYLRVCGKQRYSMFINISVAVLNIFLDWLFLAKMGKGIAFAGIATALSVSIGCALCFIPFLFNKLSLKFTRPYLTMRMLGNIFYNGSSEFLSSSTGSVLMLIVNTVLLKLGGALAVSAFSIVMYIDNILKPVVYGMSDSIQPAISYNLGAKNPNKIFELVRINFFVSFILSVSMFFIAIFNAEFLVSLFSDNKTPELINLAKNALLLVLPTYLVAWFNISTSILFTSLNKPGYSIIVMLSQTLVLPAISITILPPIFGVYGIFMMGLFSQPIAFVLAFTLYKKAKSQTKLLTQD